MSGNTQADDYRHCVPIYYPGFSALHPCPLPVQNQKQVSLSHATSAVLAFYEENLLRYGIRNQLPRYLRHETMRNFIKDAFWWIFLEHFVSVDFDALLQQVKGNTLVNDDDMKAFQFDTVVPTHIQVNEDPSSLESAGVTSQLIPTLPILRPDASVGAPTRHRLRDAAKRTPAHLAKTHSEVGNRKMEDVALIGSPRCISALSIAESIDGRPQSSRREARRRERKPRNSLPPPSPRSHHHTAARPSQGALALQPSPRGGMTASGLATPSPRSDSDSSVLSSDKAQFLQAVCDATDGGDTSDTASTSSSAVSSALRQTSFSNSRFQLHKLPIDIRLQIAAKEQHQLFTRMAMNYGAMCTASLGMNVGQKDAITRMLPEVLSQLIYFLLAKSIPYAMRLLDLPFQIALGQTLSFWLGGVERVYNVKAWGVHAYLDPVKRGRKQTRATIRGGDNTRRGARDRTASAREIDRKSAAHLDGGGPHSAERGRSTLHADYGSIAPAPPRNSNPSSLTASQQQQQQRQSTTHAAANSSPRKSDALSGIHSLRMSKTNLVPARPSDAPPPPLAAKASSALGARISDTPAPPPPAAKKSAPATGSTDGSSPAAAPSSLLSPLAGAIPLQMRSEEGSPVTVMRDADSASSAPRKSEGTALARRSDAPPSFALSLGGSSDGTSDVARFALKSTRRGVGGGTSRRDNRNALHGASGGSAEDEATLRQRRKEYIIKMDTEAMKQELNKFKTTHTFSQFHYTGLTTRQVPTFRDSDVGGDPNDGKLLGVEDRLPSRIAQAFAIGPKKRNLQVIKKDLDAKFLSSNPWYAGRNQRIPVKDHQAMQKFALNNWSPLLHRFMLANGEENLRPMEAMNWTV